MLGGQEQAWPVSEGLWPGWWACQLLGQPFLSLEGGGLWAGLGVAPEHLSGLWTALPAVPQPLGLVPALFFPGSLQPNLREEPRQA